MAQSRPSRIIQPTAKLSADNAGEIELTSHRIAIEKSRQPVPPLTAPIPTLSVPDSQRSQSTTVPSNDDGSIGSVSEPEDAPFENSGKRRIVESEDSDANTTPNKKSPRRRKTKKKKAKRASHGMFTATRDDPHD
jgi:hypothetical protein